jgi:hypothetical protein
MVYEYTYNLNMVDFQIMVLSDYHIHKFEHYFHTQNIYEDEYISNTL